MAAEVISCPACGHLVRVPDSLLGEAVRCPACKAYFTAPLRADDGTLGTAELLGDAPPPTVTASSPRRSLDGNPLFVPGIFLLFVGIVGTAVNGFQAYQAFADPDGMRARMELVKKQAAELLKMQVDDNAAEQWTKTAPIVFATVTAISLMTFIASICMLTHRFYWLAMAGSILAMFNLGNCCCLIGAPVGIYSLVKLFDPENRALFRRG